MASGIVEGFQGSSGDQACRQVNSPPPHKLQGRPVLIGSGGQPASCHSLVAMCFCSLVSPVRHSNFELRPTNSQTDKSLLSKYAIIIDPAPG